MQIELKSRLEQENHATKTKIRRNKEQDHACNETQKHTPSMTEQPLGCDTYVPRRQALAPLPLSAQRKI